MEPCIEYRQILSRRRKRLVLPQEVFLAEKEHRKVKHDRASPKTGCPADDDPRDSEEPSIGPKHHRPSVISALILSVTSVIC